MEQRPFSGQKRTSVSLTERACPTRISSDCNGDVFFAGARVSHPQRVEKEEPVQDNFKAGLSANVLRLRQPRSVQAARNSGNASTGQHKFLERVVRCLKNAMIKLDNHLLKDIVRLLQVDTSGLYEPVVR